MERHVISFHYVLRDESGEVIDSSNSDSPVTYLEGSGTIIDGLESALRSLAEGDRRKVSLGPERAYGAYDDSQVQTVDRSKLPVADLEIGAMFQAGSDRHAPTVRVIAIDGDQVKLDANHPLAGRRLHFELELVHRRKATPDEIDHGHVHGHGGVHH